MTIQNDFLIWAAGGGNVESQASYAADPSLVNGVTAGTARSALFNKSQRQSSIMAAMLAAFIVQQGGLPAVDDGTDATLLANFIASLNATGRIKLSAGANVYVNGSTGNDSTGNGTLALPWRTIFRAKNVVQSAYDLNGQTMTINVAAGAYTGGTTFNGRVVGATGPGSLVIQGAGSGSTSISVTADNCFTAQTGAMLTVNGFTLAATGTGNVGNALLSLSNSFIAVGTDVVFGVAQNNHIAAQTGGTVTATSYSITGGAAAHWAEAKGIINIGTGTINVVGSPNFSSAFASGSLGGLIEATGTTFSGSATGVRYGATLNSVIYTNGAGATYLPGNAGGTTATGGQYG